MTDSVPKLVDPAGVTLEMIVALLNQLTPEVRSELVHLLVSTHLQDCHAERELPLMIAQCLEAEGVGVFVIERTGATWRTAHNKTSELAEDVERVLDVLSCQIEGSFEGMAAELGLSQVQPS